MVSEKRINFVIIAACFIFSWWLFGKSFGYNSAFHSFRIARHQVGDFGLHLSIIRSISWGNNFPPQSPFFPGYPLPYHWGVDVVVGLLERIGIRIDLALNGVSAFAMTSLLYGIYRLSLSLFRNRLAAIVAIVLFLFPSTLTILDYIKAPTNIWRLPDYIHKGPFDGSTISLYQTLSPYLNQRHLVVALAIALFIINSTLSPIGFGLMLGLLYKVHSLIAISAFIVVFLYKKKFSVLAVCIWAIFVLLEHPVSPPISFYVTPNIFTYWWLNAGASFFLLPIGVYLAPNNAKRLFFSFLPLFILANTFKLSFRIEHNHSLINFFWIAVSIFVAFVLVKIFDRSKIIAFLLFGFLISSGILNLMVVKNDYQASFDDAPEWIKNNTATNAIFLTPRSLYDPAALAGRFSYVGPSYYLEVMGYDFTERANFSENFFKDPEMFMKEAGEREIDYVIFPDGKVVTL